MKKLLLSMSLFGAFLASQAQVVFSVEEPASIAAGYGLTYAEPTDWGVPDMTDPANAIIDTLALAFDDGNTMVSGSAAGDSAACGNIISDVAGKVAVLYRGSCEFGTKALNAENAGAVAVVIINNAGAPIAMGGGADGLNVTIPVAMISTNDGAILRNALDAGEDVVIFFGSKAGFYADDLGVTKQGSSGAPSATVIEELAQGSAEFDVTLATWVYNYGTNAQANVTAMAEVFYNGNSLYSNTSAPASIPAGDSLLVTFPAFSQATYPAGTYTIEYTVMPDMAVTDEYTTDNMYSVDFEIKSNIFSYVPLDANNEPVNSSGIRPGGTGVTSFTSCIHFQDANASRLGVRGMSFNGSTYDPDNPTDLVGRFVELKAYEWNDNFTGLDDPNFPNPLVPNTNEVASAEYTWDTDDQSETVYVDFDEAFALQDNQRYLFCVITFDDVMFLGHDNAVGYDETINQNLQPVMLTSDGNNWFTGWSDPTYPTIVLHTLPAAAVGIEEETFETTAYPNPTNNVINIPFNGVEGEAVITITDLAGKQVSNQRVNVTSTDVITSDVTGLPNGVYVFNVVLSNGASSTFNVVVSK